MAKKHGKSGKCMVGTSELSITGWSVDDSSELADSTSTTSGGKKEYTPGLEGADIALEAQWDSTKGPFDTAPNLVPGTEITDLDLYVDATNRAYAFPTAIVEKASVKSVVNGVITWSVSLKNQGDYDRVPAAA